MKKKLLVFGSLVAVMTIMASLAFSYVSENRAALVMKHRGSIAAACKAMGLYPVFTYRKDGKSSFRITATEPASARALRLAQEAQSGALSAAPLGATDPTATVTIIVKHVEKLFKLADGINYGPATFETLSGDTKIFDSTLNTNYTGNTKIEVTINGFTYETTFDQGFKTDFSEPGKGYSVIQDMFWPTPDGKNDVFCTIKWSPSKLNVKTKMKLPRNGDPDDQQFIASNTTATYTDEDPWGPNSSNNPKDIMDGDITVTVGYGLAIDINNDSNDDQVWALPGGQVASGKKKSKVAIKKVGDKKGYFILTNISATLKKAPLNRTE